MKSKNSIKTQNILDFIDKIAPFSDCSDFDNVGLLVGDANIFVKRILIALDATKSVVKQAIDENFDLVICHHPVIFYPLKTLSLQNPAVQLVNHGISMIAMHTNFDCANYGTSDIMTELLEFKTVGILNEEFPDKNKGYGRICEITESISPLALAEKAKNAFNCQKVRLLSGASDIKRIALASGGSGGEIKNALKHNCDAFIGGDIQHDKWIDAYNAGITVIDAGHFPTENIFCDYIKKTLENEFNILHVQVARDSVEPFIYV